jgi:hypothetical protein
MNLFKEHINLYDYQQKSIDQLIKHEIGQKKININMDLLRYLSDELYYITQYNDDINFSHFSNNICRDISRYLKYNKSNHRILNRNNIVKVDDDNFIVNFGYNLGILSNTVGSGKTLIVLGLIMKSKKINQNALKIYYKKKVYDNSLLSADICDVIALYLIEDNTFSYNINFNTLCQNNNIYRKITLNNDDLKIKNIIIKTNLIIVPHNLFEQWKNEIITKTNLNVKFIKDKRSFNNIEDDLLNMNYDLVLCNVNKMKHLLSIFPNSQYSFQRIFIDEVDTINYPNFPELNCEFLWLITTTYKRILKPKNNGFINNLFNNYNDLHLKILEELKFEFDEKYIHNKLKFKKINKKYFNVKNNLINSIFYKIKEESYYKFLNSYDYESLYKYITNNNNNEKIMTLDFCNRFEHNIDCYPIVIREYFYNDYNSIFFIYIIKGLLKCDSYIDKVTNGYLRNIRMSLNSLKSHMTVCPECNNNLDISLFLKSDTRNFWKLLDLIHKNKECSDAYQFKMTLLQRIEKTNQYLEYVKKHIADILYIKKQLINHNYCLKCLSTKHKYDCDDKFMNLFRNILNIDFLKFESNYIRQFQLLNSFDFIDIPLDMKLIYSNYYNNNDDIIPKNIDYMNNNYMNNNAKNEKMIDLIRMDINNNKRCLIFSDNICFFQKIKNILDDNNISNRILKGNPNTINSIIKRYTNHKIDVLLLNMKYCASGINLEMSDNIYIMNVLDSNTETQIIGRVNRIGKKNQLNVFYFFTSDEYNHYHSNDIINI